MLFLFGSFPWIRTTKLIIANDHLEVCLSIHRVFFSFWVILNNVENRAFSIKWAPMLPRKEFGILTIVVEV